MSIENPNKHYLLALNHIPSIGPRTTLKLLNLWPELKTCFDSSFKQLQEAGLSPRLAHAILSFDWDTLNADFEFEKTANQTILTLEDAAYPPLLKEIHDPPPILYAKGNLSCLSQTTLAMVGTRKPSVRGRETAWEWAKALSQSLTIVSGLAQGIDAAVHEGCLSAQGKTIAVLGTGIDIIYPRQHKNLALKISENGLLLSEFPLNTSPKPGHFPRRNRIISGLSIATLVIEAALKSGSLITARFALEQNRGVLALPGSIHLPQARGCHYLLKQGACLVTTYQEVLDELGLYAGKVQSAPPVISSMQDNVLECIGIEPTSVDAIITQSGLPMDEVITRLIKLEIDGLIQAGLGGYIRGPFL